MWCYVYRRQSSLSRMAPWCPAVISVVLSVAVRALRGCVLSVAARVLFVFSCSCSAVRVLFVSFEFKDRWRMRCAGRISLHFRDA